MHIQRILPFLRDAGYEPKVWNQYAYEEIDADIFSTKRPFPFIWWILFLFRRKAPIVHFHQFSFFHFPYIFFLSWVCKNKIFITIHNEKLIKTSEIGRRLRGLLLRMSRRVTVISVSSAVGDLLSGLGVKDVVCLPAYVPPVITKKKKLPTDVDLKVVFNAWRIGDENDVTVYGVDLLCNLARIYSSISFYVFVGDISSCYIGIYIRSKGLRNITVILGESLVDYLEDADFFLRLNREDAYGVSIQEALDLRVPALASDACRRPQGCVLFENGNFLDLVGKFDGMLNTERTELIKERVITRHHVDLIELYKSRVGF